MFLSGSFLVGVNGTAFVTFFTWGTFRGGNQSIGLIWGYRLFCGDGVEEAVTSRREHIWDRLN